jgi:hypothetical protein
VAFVLVGLFALLILLAGTFAANPGLALGGGGAVALSAAGYAWYWQRAKHWPLAHLYPERLVFVRGPQRGVLEFQTVTGVHVLQWARSLFPFSRGQKVLVLQTPVAEWQIGVEFAESEQFQEQVLAALQAFAARRA